MRQACPHIIFLLCIQHYKHNLIKEKLLDLIECTFKRALKTMVHFFWHVMTERLFSLPLTKVGIHFGHVRMCATPYPISLIMMLRAGSCGPLPQ